MSLLYFSEWIKEGWRAFSVSTFAVMIMLLIMFPAFCEDTATADQPPRQAADGVRNWKLVLQDEIVDMKACANDFYPEWRFSDKAKVVEVYDVIDDRTSASMTALITDDVALYRMRGFFRVKLETIHGTNESRIVGLRTIKLRFSVVK